MHPGFERESAGDCAICGMRLIPAPASAAVSGAAVQGRFPIRISAETFRALGLRTSAVRLRPLERWVRAAGRRIRGKLRVPLPPAEISLVRPGQDVRATSPEKLGMTWRCKVEKVEDGAAWIRPLGELPPGEDRCLVEIQALLGEVLTIPADAVVPAEEGPLVYVVGEKDHFYPRAVRLGRLGEGYWEVLSGLREGERVASGSTPFFDSASRLQTAFSSPP